MQEERRKGGLVPTARIGRARGPAQNRASLRRSVEGLTKPTEREHRENQDKKTEHRHWLGHIGKPRALEHHGPDLHVFVPPNEADARFGWQDDTAAAGTVSQLLGLNSEDPNEAGIDSQDLPGFVLTNGQADGNNELTAHSAAFAAEILAAYADNLQGNVATILSTNRRGNSQNAASASGRPTATSRPTPSRCRHGVAGRASPDSCVDS